MKLRTRSGDRIVGIGRPAPPFSVDVQVGRMVLEVAGQTIREGRCGTIRVEADNATRAALAAVKQAIRSERQPLGAVGVLAEIRDSATQRIIAENAVFRRYGKKKHLAIPHRPLGSSFERAGNKLKFPFRSHGVSLKNRGSKMEDRGSRFPILNPLSSIFGTYLSAILHRLSSILHSRSSAVFIHTGTPGIPSLTR